MSQEGHFDEEGLVDLFCGDYSFEEEVGVDDDDHKDNDCAAEVELVEVEVEEVVQETMLKHRRTTTRTIIKKKYLNQMSEDELAAQLDDLIIIKNESMQDFCFTRGKVGVCTCMHILSEEQFRSPMVKYLVDLKLNKSKAEIDSLVLEWYKYASRAGVVHSSTSAHATPCKLWYNIPYNGSDAYARPECCN
jgi:hypothetical protein